MSGAAIPRSRNTAGFALLGLGGLLILACGAARLSGFAAPPAPAPVVASVMLHFVDQPNGTVNIIDAGSGRVIEVIPAEGGGFLRSSMRVMATERTNNHFGPQMPFELLARADNRLQLIDTATGQVLELEAFGPSNEAEFEKILNLAEAEK